VSDTLVEVEAYLPAGDAAAHVFRGETPRTRILFGPPGFAYLYLNYGLHWMLNIAVEPEGVPGCVLLRATSRFAGPGLLTRAFGLTGDHYGADCTGTDFHLLDAPSLPDSSVLVTPRIGITQAAGLPLRFVQAGFEKRKRQPQKELPRR
jgi:DNA-3-methyladenine glycosylase